MPFPKKVFWGFVLLMSGTAYGAQLPIGKFDMLVRSEMMDNGVLRAADWKAKVTLSCISDGKKLRYHLAWQVNDGLGVNVQSAFAGDCDEASAKFLLPASYFKGLDNTTLASTLTIENNQPFTFAARPVDKRIQASLVFVEGKRPAPTLPEFPGACISRKEAVQKVGMYRFDFTPIRNYLSKNALREGEYVYPNQPPIRHGFETRTIFQNYINRLAQKYVLIDATEPLYYFNEEASGGGCLFRAYVFLRCDGSIENFVVPGHCI